MKIACLSGKGGAGKTFTAVNLAVSAGKATYIDCDVEEPNGHIFLKPEEVEETTVFTTLPEFAEDKCVGCKKCVEFCRFHALIYVKGKHMVFSEVCHSCGGCMMVCPENAISESPKAIGTLEIGWHKDTKVVTGILNPGEASGVHVIQEALDKAEGLTIIDCPPGSACSVMESVMDADYCLLVVEPTAFGFHNFKMVHELVTLLGKKSGVIINKEDVPYEPLEEFCREYQIPIHLRIPYDREIARLTGEGKIVAEERDEWKIKFQSLLQTIGGAV